MFVEESQIPFCQYRLEKNDPPCGTPMFRIGTEQHWAFVCPKCDKVPIEKRLDNH